MESIKLTFLGTGNAIPTKLRSHTAILINYKNETILLDCGEGAQRQFKIAEISPAKLTKLLITHWHGDHTLGIPGLMQTLRMSDYSKTLQIYGPRGTKEKLQLFEKIYGVLYEKFKINVEIFEVSSGKFIDEKEFFIEAFPIHHGTPTLAYSFVLKDKLRINKEKLKKLKLPNSPLLKKLQEGKDIIFNGKKIKSKEITYLEKGKKITIILDTGVTSNVLSLAKNSDLLVCEASFSNEEKKLAREYNHLTAADAATLAKKAKVKKLILTHISQRYEHSPEIILNEAKKIFKNTTLAKDLDVVEI